MSLAKSEVLVILICYLNNVSREMKLLPFVHVVFLHSKQKLKFVPWNLQDFSEEYKNSER
jgi:hypothetical protein